jgi:midasin
MSHLNEILNRYKKEKDLFPEVSAQDLDTIEQIKLDLMHLRKRWQAIFVWQDGPLVQAMKNGDLFLIDEISLADDSVLERLNSVLEPERKLVCSFFVSHLSLNAEFRNISNTSIVSCPEKTRLNLTCLFIF